MRAVIQRVTAASVSVGGEQISSIGRGLCILIGIGEKDTPFEVEYISKKILSLKLFPALESEPWGWNKSVVDGGFEILCVSQFTLYAKTKGSKLDFHDAMAGDRSKTMYEEFLEGLRKQHPGKIQDGKFGAMMNVEISNDGPVTIILDSNDGPAPPAPKNLEIAAAKTKAKKEANELTRAKREAAKEQEKGETSTKEQE